jgi:hypothetical protein
LEYQLRLKQPCVTVNFGVSRTRLSIGNFGICGNYKQILFWSDSLPDINVVLVKEVLETNKIPRISSSLMCSTACIYHARNIFLLKTTCKVQSHCEFSLLCTLLQLLQ